jgi:hypothetical protein
MSIIVDVLQSPLTLTPSNANHVWNIRSSAYTLNDFQYIVDVYFKADLQDWSQATTDYRACRLKVRPNSYGNGIIDLEEIVRTFLEANVLFTGTTYPFLNYANDVNKIVTLADGTTTIKYDTANLWPGGSPNASIDQYYHVSQYKVVLGSSYTSGNTVVEDVVYGALWQPDPINIFPGVDNKLIPSPYLSAATINIQGANWFAVNNQNHLYYDLFRHKYETGEDSECGPRELLNAAGRDYQTISQPDFVSHRVRRRKHHPDCPIVISFLDGDNDYFVNNNSKLVVRGALSHGDPYTYSAKTNNVSKLSSVVTEDLFKMGVFYLPYNLTASGLNVIPTNSKKLAFYLSNAEISDDLSFSARTSEVLEYYIQDRSCVNTPIHVLFLNANGQWDTFTFGGKSEKTYNIKRNTYRKENSLNKQFYNVGSWQRGTTSYENEVNWKMACETWYMDENDVEIIQEIFMSPEVYMIEGTTKDQLDCIPDVNDCASCLEEIRLYQNLVPVTISDDTFVVWNKNYQKLYQYKFNLNYSGFKRYRTQG